MEFDSFDFGILWNFFSSVIFHLVIFGTSLYYIYNKQRIDGFLIAAGSFIHILTSTFYTLILPLMVRNFGTEIYSRPFLMTAVSIITFIGSVLFLIGFIVLITDHLALLRQVNNKSSF